MWEIWTEFPEPNLSPKPNASHRKPLESKLTYWISLSLCVPLSLPQINNFEERISKYDV